MKVHSNKIRVLFLIVPSIIFGIIIGIGWQSKCPIEIDNKIRYSELLNWITAILVGVLIGYILKNKDDNNKVIKAYLIDDLKKISIEISNIKDYTQSLRSIKNFDELQRKDIISRINVIDKKIKVFLDFLFDCKQNEHQSISNELVNSLNSFNKAVTGDNFYADPIQSLYFDELIREGAKFEGTIRQILIKIIRTF